MRLNSPLKVTLYLEVVFRRCSIRNVFLKIPVPEYLIKLQGGDMQLFLKSHSGTGAFLWIFVKFLTFLTEHFRMTTSVHYHQFYFIKCHKNCECYMSKKIHKSNFGVWNWNIKFRFLFVSIFSVFIIFPSHI